MITSIQVNYTDRGVLGEYETRSDRLEGFLTAEHIDKAVEFVVRHGDMAAAHFNHDDGSNDAIWQEWDQRGTRKLTWRHDNGPWSHNEPIETDSAAFKRMAKKLLK